MPVAGNYRLQPPMVWLIHGSELNLPAMCCVSQRDSAASAAAATPPTRSQAALRDSARRRSGT